jgi:hypothetical protein
MVMFKFLSAALVAVAMLVTPAMARESDVSSRHAVEDANASTTPGARHILGGDGLGGNHFGGGFGGTPGDGYGGYGNDTGGMQVRSPGYRGRDVWGHWGTYYGPMVPTI